MTKIDAVRDVLDRIQGGWSQRLQARRALIAAGLDRAQAKALVRWAFAARVPASVVFEHEMTLLGDE